jgi:RND family efflux transporter MFP subunit
MMQDHVAIPRFRLGLALTALSLSACAESPMSAPLSAGEPPFEVIEVTTTSIADERLVDGRIEGLQQATVTAQVPGQVTAIVRDAEAQVAAGEPVLRLRSTQAQGGLAQAEAGLREAEALATDAEARYQRIKSLYERKVVPRATYDQVLAQRESAEARVAAARAARDAASAYTLVTAPFAGVVTERVVRLGDTVAPGMPLFGVAARGGLRLRAQLPESLVAAARQSREIVIHHQGQRIRTENILIYASADARDGSFGLQADILTPLAGLEPGMLVKVGVMEGERQGLQIPSHSVITRGEITGAYVYSASGIRFRQLRLGAVIDDRVEVLAGLKAGERVARDPNEALAALRSGQSDSEAAQ